MPFQLLQVSLLFLHFKDSLGFLEEIAVYSLKAPPQGKDMLRVPSLVWSLSLSQVLACVQALEISFVCCATPVILAACTRV